MSENAIGVGDFVEMDGLIGVVVKLEDCPEDHIAVWFGMENQKRKSEGSENVITPEVWTIPTEYFKKTDNMKVLH